MIGRYLRNLRDAVATVATRGIRCRARDAAACATLASATNKAAAVGAGTAVTAWYFSNEFFGFVGMLAAIAGSAATVYFRRRETQAKERYIDHKIALRERADRRAAELHASTMQERYGHGSKRRRT